MASEARQPAIIVGGALAMAFVGGSVAVSGGLVTAPLWTVQAIRYGIGCVLLIGSGRLRRIPIRRPSGAQWCLLAGVTLMGLVLFNFGLVAGADHAEPAVLGVAIACVPVILAVIGPLLEGSSVRGQAVAAAGVVTVGAACVQGFGHSDLIGCAYAVLVFACEASFTLLAVPLLASHGAYGVSVHTTWMAAVAFGVLGVLFDGPGAALHLTSGAWFAVGYLAVLVTAAAFVLWYGCRDARCSAGRPAGRHRTGGRRTDRHGTGATDAGHRGVARHCDRRSRTDPRLAVGSLPGGGDETGRRGFGAR